jgi:AcrR family transcriptional regulator
VYHHFASKEAVLAAGIERQLARLDALGDIRRVFPLGDLKAELTLTARYLLAELDEESELLRILAFEGRNRPQPLTDAVERLVQSAFTGFATWIAERADGRMTSEQASALSAVGLGSLFSSGLMRDVLGVAVDVDEQALVDTWVQTMTTMIERG